MNSRTGTSVNTEEGEIIEITNAVANDLLSTVRIIFVIVAIYISSLGIGAQVMDSQTVRTMFTSYLTLMGMVVFLIVILVSVVQYTDIRALQVDILLGLGEGDPVGDLLIDGSYAAGLAMMSVVTGLILLVSGTILAVGSLPTRWYWVEAFFRVLLLTFGIVVIYFNLSRPALSKIIRNILD